MNALERFDAEIAQRDLSLVRPDQLDQVRRLVRHPESGQDILYERLVLGSVALDEHETDKRWQLWELLLTAYRICQDVLDERRQELKRQETWRRHHDPERQEQIRRFTALNQRSLRAYLEHEQSQTAAQNTATAPQVARQPEISKRQPTLRRRH